MKKINTLIALIFSSCFISNASAGTQAYQNGLGTNPDMSKAKVHGFFLTF